MGIAFSENRAPGQVVDSSVCGLNSRCSIPEHTTVPSAKDVLRSFPLRNTQEELLGFSIDRVVLHPSERGLVGFSNGGKLHFYNVTPFGAVFWASWWARLGGWILRAMHLLLWFSHAGFLYVDDFLFFQHRSMMPTSAALLLIFFVKFFAFQFLGRNVNFLHGYNGLDGNLISTAEQSPFLWKNWNVCVQRPVPFNNLLEQQERPWRNTSVY